MQEPKNPQDCPGASARPEPSYFSRHVFFCLNQRDAGQACCAQYNAGAMFAHCKEKVRQLGLGGPGKVRVNKAGCLDRCSAGPVLVVYPEAVWYTYTDEADIDEIVQSHLKDGQVVQRLQVPPEAGR